ncbi:MAG: Gfo/Idh/MocA family oxidoreductase [Deltaproteobacteria bacterium]|nr:Gfo/Idh/MocA family oxidoreductase [Deltaproteobacteria bacterium]
MKQIVQNARTGKLELAEVPTPAAADGQVLVRNHYSVVSPGTEMMAMDFARKSLLGKARSRPDLVKQVIQKIRHEGPLPTYRAVMTRLDSPQSLGYSCAGVVEEVGAGVAGFVPGDRVACAGAGYANHAEWVSVPENLVVRVPDSVPLEKAAFATLGAISLQGLRVAEPTLGEIAVVVGLGMVGQLAVQLLIANGCRVLGIDLDPVRIEQARGMGAEWGAQPGDDHSAWIAAATKGAGADFAIICAASERSEPIQLAADLCRAKGRVVCVGATAMDLDRRSFFEKELDLRMSMSYGPGRYDRHYEELGLDYPISYVRWTENRNLEAVIALTDSGAIDPEQLDIQTTPFDAAAQTYEDLAGGERKSLAVLFRYDPGATTSRSIVLAAKAERPARNEVGVAFIGAGNYAKGILLPAVNRCKSVSKRAIVTATGASGRSTAEKFGFAACGTDPETVFSDPDVHLVFIATQHDSHAPLAEAALRAGKAVWLEKPAALTETQLVSLATAVQETNGFLTIGYNRRFSPHARAVREAFADRRGPMSIHYTVAAGATPGGTWHTDPNVGGGRIIGEGCHFVDLCSYLVGQTPTSAFARGLGRDPETEDSTVVMLGWGDGSTATIAYLANASSELPKERFEISAEGRTAICDNFRSTRILGGETTKTMNQDKGQTAAVEQAIEAVRGGRPSPIALPEIVAVTRATFAIRESVRTQRAVAISRELKPAAG